MNKENKTKL